MAIVGLAIFLPQIRLVYLCFHCYYWVIVPMSEAKWQSSLLQRNDIKCLTELAWLEAVSVCCHREESPTSSSSWWTSIPSTAPQALLLVLLLITWIIANPTIHCFVYDAFLHDATSLIISILLFLMCFTLHLRLFTTSLSQFHPSVVWAPCTCPYPLFCLLAQITIRHLRWSSCKWFCSWIFSKCFHKDFQSHFHSVSRIYLFFKMSSNIFS